MPYILLEEHLAALPACLEYDKIAAAPIRELTKRLIQQKRKAQRNDHAIVAETLYQAASTKLNLAIAFTICYISIMFSDISSMLVSVYLPG